MVVYEVNISIEDNCRAEYLKWLKVHVNQMLNIEGFQKTEVFLEVSSSRIIVKYYVENQEMLDNYLKFHASKMRNDGLKKFEGKFAIDRRVLSPLEL